MNSPHKQNAMSATTIVLFITVIATALITGLWYAYSCSVNGGLGKLGDREYLLAMQSINRVILNPLFFATFMGTLVLLPLSTWLSYREPGSVGGMFLLAASAVYIIGVFGVTIGGNVPLNDALDAFDIKSASAQAIADQRLAFEALWNKLHGIRGMASLAAFILLLVGCIDHIKSQVA
jgi:uncharacterized membrane protein